MTNQAHTDTDQHSGASNRPTHKVTFRRKTKDGYAKANTIGGAWINSKGGISFAFAGGQITIWPDDQNAAT